MHKNEVSVLKSRVGKFRNRVKRHILGEHILLNAVYRHSVDPIPFADREGGDYLEISEGTTWGDRWDSAWFHLTGTIPADWKGKTVVAELDFNGEGLLFDCSGKVLQGLTNGSVFDSSFNRSTYELQSPCEGGEAVELWAEAAANGLFGIQKTQDPERDDPNRHGTFSGVTNRMRLAVFNEDVKQLSLDVNSLFSLIEFLDTESIRFARIMRALNKAVDVYEENPDNANAARAELATEMSRHADASALTCNAVGHAHIDTGWLWPVRESIRKSARTFSSQLGLIEKYPGYIFGASQPQHYQFVKDHYPELYERVKAAIADGTWECQGGMWVEADCNIISGESMVRQFVHGKNYYMDEFGVDVKNLWIPDVFGYSAAMPQIMKKAGCDYFVTQKLSWNQINKMPHTTFKWRGLDGSEVITHFPPENTYNSNLSAETLHNGTKNLQEKAYMEGYLSLFGVGDGGGGPSVDHIENGLRHQNMEGLPKVTFGKAQDFLDSLDAHWDDLPTWVGELYFELHRGTLTSQAKTKRNNRFLENRLRQVEYLYSCLPLEHYPLAELDALWKVLLINQFHDIIPGSSINLVYQVTEKEHAEALKSCVELINAAESVIGASFDDTVTLVNCLSVPYERPVTLPTSWSGFEVVDESGTPLPVQGENVAVRIPAYGQLTVKKTETPIQAVAESGDVLVLENDLIRYEFNKDAQLISAFDKENGREVILEDDPGNVLSLYEDRPNNWDAWDVDLFYENQLLETAQGNNVEILPAGGVQSQLVFDLTIGSSTIKQVISLTPGSKRLDFATIVEWDQRHQMLRVAFPLTVSSDKASYDIQYGYTERPTHRNTSWDTAKFEVAAHKYADLSTRDYGVALMNDCKYGYKVLDNVLDLNLLRSPVYPDPEADQGTQVFTYSLLPHVGPMVESTVMAEAAQLNMPPIMLRAAVDRQLAPCAVDGEGVSMEVLKRAEKDDCLVIRLVETQGRESTCTVNAGSGITQAIPCDLMEWHDDEAIDCTNGLPLAFTPFEIKTFKLK